MHSRGQRSPLGFVIAARVGEEKECFSPLLKMLHGLGDTLGRPWFACGHTSLMDINPNP